MATPTQVWRPELAETSDLLGPVAVPRGAGRQPRHSPHAFEIRSEATWGIVLVEVQA